MEKIKWSHHGLSASCSSLNSVCLEAYVFSKFMSMEVVYQKFQFNSLVLEL
jgi:hypothetical protein